MDNKKPLKVTEKANDQSSKTLGDRFKQDKLGPHSGKSVKDTQQQQQHRKTEGPDHKQQGQKKGDELVKYMSNLPNYLEKGEEKQEKAFNVGVLEWGRLEKWQHNNQRQLFRESSTYSPSSSNTSSNSSTSQSSKRRTITPGRLRSYHTTAESSRRCIKSSDKGVFLAAADDVVAIRSDYDKVQRPEESKPKHHHHHRHQESENRCCAPLDSKGKFKVQDESIGSNHHQQTVVLLRPKDKQEIKPDSLKAKQRTPFDHSDSKWIGQPSIEQPNSTRAIKEIRFPFETRRPLVQSRGSSISPLRFKTAENKSNKEFTGPTMAATVKVARERALAHQRANKIPEDNLNKELGDSTVVIRKGALVHTRVSSVSPVRNKTPVDKLNNNTITEQMEVKNQKLHNDNKARNISPFRRFSFSVGKIVKSSSSDDLSGLAQISNHQSALNTSCENSNSNANRKTTASPLRRILDPFLKTKSGNTDNSLGSASGDGNGNLSNRLAERESHGLNSVKVKLDLGSCKEIDIDHPNDMDQNGSTTVQALLQVALKNGLPLFTFAVDNNNDILAATMTRLSSGKKDGNNNWIFTFFMVHEMKKKSGSWLNYASKDRKQGYIPNVVGQMKVSDVPNPDFIGKKSADIFRIREFVLLGVNLRHSDEKSSDLQANDELAAIVLKLPTLDTNHSKNPVQKLSTVNSKDLFQKSDNLLGLTAILPGGQHGLPCNGRPSPLIERWRFGGSCDCGGWDLGCRLRVFTSETRSSSETALTSKKIHLYSQDHTIEECKASVSLSPFKDGIYSVEFDSSLKLVQAFSICIAILNGLKPLEFLLDPNNTRSNNNEGAKHPHIIDEEDIPACFVSCPPGTPADKV